MARVLGIDVTGPGGGVALGERVELLGPDVPRGRDLVPLVRRILAAEGLRAADLDAIACGVGPGSFTGIRIGVATAATLAYAAGLPVVAVGSLHGIAANAPTPRVLVALDARRGQVFCARFPEGAYEVLPPADAVAGWPDDGLVLGDARAKYPDVFERFPGRADAPVRPDVVAKLGEELLARGETLKPEELHPRYMRLSDPEIRRRENSKAVGPRP